MAVNFETDIQYLKGVGPKLGSVLAKRGVYTVGDLLEWYPRTYEGANKKKIRLSNKITTRLLKKRNRRQL
jgi:ATP-dependent DNA helicase RecG